MNDAPQQTISGELQGVGSEEDKSLTRNPWVTTISMLISILLYQFLLGWEAAITFTLLLLIHEMGHVVVAQRRGIPCSVPVFVPFMGAFIKVSAKVLKSARDEAWIGIGGPLVGGLGCAVALLVWKLWFTGHEDVGKGIALGILVNLVNLVPIRPLDGGRIVQIVGRWAQVPGLVLLALWTWFSLSPVLILVWMAVISEFNRKSDSVSLVDRVSWAIGYLLLFIGLVGLLLVHEQAIKFFVAFFS